MTNQRFYTLTELAKITHFSRQHLYTEAARGKLILRKAGGRTVILAEDVDRWIASFPVISSETAA